MGEDQPQSTGASMWTRSGEPRPITLTSPADEPLLTHPASGPSRNRLWKTCFWTGRVGGVFSKIIILGDPEFWDCQKPWISSFSGISWKRYSPRPALTQFGAEGHPFGAKVVFSALVSFDSGVLSSQFCVFETRARDFRFCLIFDREHQFARSRYIADMRRLEKLTVVQVELERGFSHP